MDELKRSTYKAVYNSAMVNFDDPRMVSEYIKHGWTVYDWTGKRICRQSGEAGSGKE